MRGDNDRDGTLNARIDDALRSYADPGETPDTRIVLARLMERAQEREAHPRRFWLWLIPVSASAVALLIVAFLWVSRFPQVVPPHPQIASALPSPAENPAPHSPMSSESELQTHVPKQLRAAIVRPKSQLLPKLDVFPTPRPLTPEEQQLEAFANQAQPTAKRKVLAAQQHVDDPLDIAELQVPPLTEVDTPDSPNPAQPNQTQSQDQPKGKDQR